MTNSGAGNASVQGLNPETSQAAVFNDMISALVKAEDILGPNRIWAVGEDGNPSQNLFIYDFLPGRDQLDKFSSEELRNWISWNADELNKVLRDEGFEIQLQPFGPDQFGVVAVLKVKVAWAAEGQKTWIYSENLPQPTQGFVLSSIARDDGGNKTEVFKVFKTENYSELVARVNTQTSDKVFLTIADKPLTGTALASRINEIRRGLTNAQEVEIEELKVPMVNFNRQIDVDWLIGLNTVSVSGQRARIVQALQQVKFKMNEKGAKVESAFAAAIELECCFYVPELVLDKPFFVWIEKEGVDIPVFYGYIGQDSWNDPGDLDTE